jgi:phospholipid/cholesterol/gamma-HCH transport system substrate-binding protein
MEVSYKQEVSVGVMVIAGLVAFTGAMFWLTGRSITSHGLAVAVVFKDVGGLREGDPVRVSGVTKGRVEQVHLERMGRVLVTLRLDAEVAPRSDATARVASADFLGAMFVDYDPGSAATPLPPGVPIPGVTEEQFTSLAARAASSASQLIESVNAGLNPGQLATDIHNTLVLSQRGMRALTDLTTGPTVQQTTATLSSVQHVMARIDSILGTKGAVRSGERLDTLSANLTELTSHLAQATSSLDTLLTRMSRGEGTFGRMATDTLLYKNLNTTLSALSALLTDLRERPGRYLTVKVF